MVQMSYLFLVIQENKAKKLYMAHVGHGQQNKKSVWEDYMVNSAGGHINKKLEHGFFKSHISYPARYQYEDAWRQHSKG